MKDNNADMTMGQRWLSFAIVLALSTLGAMVYGMLQAQMGWYQASLVFLVPVAAVALVASLLVKMPASEESTSGVTDSTTSSQAA